MIRRSFRRGLTLGLLGGAAATVAKAVRSRRAPAPVVPAWPPMPDTVPVTVPDPIPEPVTEVHTGTAAEEHFADASRQVERPLSDWEPTAPLPPAQETTPLTPDVVEEAPEPPAPAPAPAPAKPKKAPAKKKAAAPRKKAAPAAPAIDPVDGECPETHPVKGKLASKIFHVPGGFNYPRTRPDRCYVDATAAEAEGLRPSKR